MGKEKRGVRIERRGEERVRKVGGEREREEKRVDEKRVSKRGEREDRGERTNSESGRMREGRGER